jgi:hypothetical protein
VINTLGKKKMCAAILSAYGKKFEADRFLNASPFRGSAEVWHVGEKAHRDSGFQIVVNDVRNLKIQIEGCVAFVRRHLPELKRLRHAEGIEAVDFRIAYFWDEKAAALAYTLPEELHLALAHVPASLTFCVYPHSEKGPTRR